MAFDIYPFLRAHRNFPIDGLSEPLLDDVQLLDPENLARTHHGACIVQLVNIFERDGKMISAPREHIGDFAFAAFGHECLEISEQRVVHFFAAI
jgi:hypothetical protein